MSTFPAPSARESSSPCGNAGLAAGCAWASAVTGPLARKARRQAAITAVHRRAPECGIRISGDVRRAMGILVSLPILCGERRIVAGGSQTDELHGLR